MISVPKAFNGLGFKMKMIVFGRREQLQMNVLLGPKAQSLGNDGTHLD